MKTSLRWTCLGIALLTITSGCTGYHIKPEATSITPARASAPIPVVVGITQVDQNVVGGFPDLAQHIKKSLDDSGLFKSVYYPVRPNDALDGGMKLHINAKFKMDGAWFPKAFFSGFFMLLPTPFVYYNHQYYTDCSLDLARGDRKLKTYTATGIATASHKVLAPEEQWAAEGTEAAIKLLGANLVEQLINDRAFIEKELKGPQAAAN